MPPCAPHSNIRPPYIRLRQKRVPLAPYSSGASFPFPIHPNTYCGLLCAKTSYGHPGNHRRAQDSNYARNKEQCILDILAQFLCVRSYGG